MLMLVPKFGEISFYEIDSQIRKCFGAYCAPNESSCQKLPQKIVQSQEKSFFRKKSQLLDQEMFRCILCTKGKFIQKTFAACNAQFKNQTKSFFWHTNSTHLGCKKVMRIYKNFFFQKNINSYTSSPNSYSFGLRATDLDHTINDKTSYRQLLSKRAV